MIFRRFSRVKPSDKLPSGDLDAAQPSLIGNMEEAQEHWG